MDGIKTKKKGGLSIKKVHFAWCVLIPILLYYFIFNLVPLFLVLLLSFVDWNGLRFDEINWIGFDNYIEFFTTPEYYTMLFNTILVGVLNIFGAMVLGFLAAVFLTKKIKGTTFYRTIWYIPTIVSIAVMSQIVSTLLNPTSGVINNILMQSGKEPILWQQSRFWMFFWIILLCIWRGIGGTMLLFMAGLNGISPEIYEAAAIDGVNPWQKLIRITLPNMRKMLAFVLITSFMGLFSLFEPVQIISNGGPGESTKVIMFQIYDEAFANLRVGMSSAIAVLVLIMVLIITYVNMKLTKMKV